MNGTSSAAAWRAANSARAASPIGIRNGSSGLSACPFHNAAVESGGSLASTDEIVRTHKLEFTRRLVAVAHEAGAADPHLLGQQLAVLFEGATAMATSLNDTAPVVHARAAAAMLIDAALAASDNSGGSR
jgi:hypothetical protein